MTAASAGTLNELSSGSGSLDINATQINFGWSAFNTYGFGRSVTLAAADGMFATGKGSFDLEAEQVSGRHGDKPSSPYIRLLEKERQVAFWHLH